MAARLPSGPIALTCSDPAWARNGETLNGRGAGVPAMREGDIVITRVAHHYSLGRISADNQTQTSLESHDHRAEAIRRACAVAGQDQQVFIYEEAESSAHVLLNCETPAGGPNNSIFTAVDLSPAPGGRVGEIANPQSPAWKDEQTWAFFATIRDHAVMQGRGVVLTTTNKLELDQLTKEESYALEVVGGLVDRARILAELKAETRLARTARRQAIRASIAARSAE